MLHPLVVKTVHLVIKFLKKIHKHSRSQATASSDIAYRGTHHLGTKANLTKLTDFHMLSMPYEHHLGTKANLTKLTDFATYKHAVACNG